jgi:hypothetical protein
MEDVMLMHHRGAVQELPHESAHLDLGERPLGLAALLHHPHLDLGERRQRTIAPWEMATTAEGCMRRKEAQEPEDGEGMEGSARMKEMVINGWIPAYFFWRRHTLFSLPRRL